MRIARIYTRSDESSYLEHFGDIAETASEYFSHAIVHSARYELNSVRADADNICNRLSIFSHDFRSVELPSSFNNRKSIKKINCKINSGEDVIWDMPPGSSVLYLPANAKPVFIIASPPETAKSPCEVGIFKKGNMSIQWILQWCYGIYDIKNNNLYLRDLSHYSRHLTENFMHIIKALKLHPIKKMPQISEKEFNSNVNILTIGGDPEFELLESITEYKVCNAKRFFHESKSEIGLDDMESILELRPRYACSHRKYIRNLAELINRVKYPISTIGEKYPLGAHIHFGYENTSCPQDKVRNWLAFVSILKDYLGVPLIELNSQERMHSQYSDTSGWEVKRNGSGIEYRALAAVVNENIYISHIVHKIAWRLFNEFIKTGVPEDYDEKYLRTLITEKEFVYMMEFVAGHIAKEPVPLFINGMWSINNLPIAPPITSKPIVHHGQCYNYVPGSMENYFQKEIPGLNVKIHWLDSLDLPFGILMFVSLENQWFLNAVSQYLKDEGENRWFNDPDAIGNYVTCLFPLTLRDNLEMASVVLVINMRYRCCRDFPEGAEAEQLKALILAIKKTIAVNADKITMSAFPKPDKTKELKLRERSNFICV